MFKPIRTVNLKTVGLGMRFSRKITERAAIVGSYELSESELVFAMGAAREKYDLLSVLELLDKVLDLIKRGFDRRVNAITLRIINNVGIMLGRGGFSREYFNAAEIYNKISAAVYGKNENFNISEYRSEIHNQLSVLRSEQIKQTSKTSEGKNKRLGVKALRLHKTVLERETLTVNTLNSGLLRITVRNPELMKMLKLDKIFMELSLKNIERVRRRTERAMAVQRFFDSLTKAQIGLLERFVVNENLFLELRENSIDKPDLKYLLENSSEKSRTEFFEILRQKIELQATMQSKQSYFNSAEEMKEFFVTAKRGDIERLIKVLEKDSLYGSEVKTLTEALRIYTEKRGIKSESETLMEIFYNSETALNHIKQRINDENFSVERFINVLGTSSELKKFFAEYAWENYRSDETLSRYAEYIRNAASEDKLSDFGQTVFQTDNGTESSVENFAGVISKNSFAEFLINSGELSLKFSESVKNSFLSASPDAVSAFAEYLVKTVREDHSEYYSKQIHSIAEKAENILHYGDPNSEKKSAETFSLISGMWNENAVQLSELYTSFTQSRIGYEEILKLYSYLPKTDFKAVSEFFEAVVRKDEFSIDLSQKRDIKNESEMLTEIYGNSEAALEHIKHGINDGSFSVERFINALGTSSELKKIFAEYAWENYRSDETLIRYSKYIRNTVSGQTVFQVDDNIKSESAKALIDVPSMISFAEFLISSGELSLKFSEGVKNNFLSASPDVVSAFAEYLVNSVREDSSKYYSEQMRLIAEKAENILYYGNPNSEEKSAEAFSLISGMWNESALQLSELYASFTQSRIGSEEILGLYSYLPKTNFKAVSEFFEAAAQEDKYFTDLSKNFSEIEKQYSVLNNIELFDIKEESAEGYNTFYDVLRGMSENTLTLLLPLAGVTGRSGFVEKNTNIDHSGSTALADQTSAFVITTVFAEYLSDTIRGDISNRYNERIHTLAERLGEILHDESPNINESIRESRSAETIDLIYNEWNYDHTQISELYKSFTENFANREDIQIRSRLLQNDLARITGIPSYEITNSAANFFGLNGGYLKQPEKFFEQMKVFKNITNADFHNSKDRGSDNGEALENMSELVFSLADTHNGTFRERLSDASSSSDKGFTASKLSRILADLTSLSSILNRTERRIYNIAQSENKRIVTNKAFYNAFTVLFGGDVSENTTNGILSENFYSASDLTPREFFFTWENKNVTLFNRAAANKTYIRTNGFFEKRSSIVLALSDRISEKFSAENQHSDYNTAVELFYTDEYFERSGVVSGSPAVNYAVPAAAASGSSDEVSEKIGTIRSAIDSINTEIISIRQHEEEISREFVTKSEQKIFERELKGSIERDIFLAGKRHGIY